MLEVDYTTYDLSKNGLPQDVGELIKLLQAKFPDALPDKVIPIEEVTELIGEQNIIRFLTMNYRRA